MTTGEQMQQAFNASAMLYAASFAPIGGDPERAMEVHIYNGFMAACRRRGIYVMPRHMEVRLCRAWDEHANEFLAMAAESTVPPMGAGV